MIGKPEVLQWLSHRAGVEKLQELPLRLRDKRKALELTEQGKPFVQKFGQREIKGFVGFIDLIGFSERVKGWESGKISTYLKPFLSGIIERAVDRYALIDKTIGDEVMFVLPDIEEDDGAPAVLLMGQLLGGLYDFQRELGADYPFRIGLAYGKLYIDHVKGKGYSEWTIIGEVVHLAKRLHSLEELKQPSSIAGAFGMLIREKDIITQFDVILKYIAGFASRMTYEVIDKPVDDFKGVSTSRCALLLPKDENN